MSEFKVEKDIPIINPKNVYPFNRMYVGDSFYVSNTSKRFNTVRRASKKYSRTHPGVKFSSHIITDCYGETGLRIWRTH